MTKHVGGDPGVDAADRGEQVGRQVEAVPLGVLDQIAENVGELQGLPEAEGQPLAGLCVQAEYARRKTPDGAGDPVAIENQLFAVDDPHPVRRVHFHAVDDGEEVRLAQLEAPDRPGEGARQQPHRPAGVERGDGVAPQLQAALLFIQLSGFVGDVVDLAAERINSEHRLPLLSRQQPHRPVERGARGAHRRLDLHQVVRTENCRRRPRHGPPVQLHCFRLHPPLSPAPARTCPFHGPPRPTR